MKKIFAVVVIIVSVFQLNGCSTPETTVKKERVIPVNRIIKRIEAKRRKVKFFYGTGVLAINSNKFTGKANFEIWIKKPDSIKISVFGPFGLDVGELLVTNKGYKFYDAFKNVLYIGKNKERVIKKLFNTGISFSDMIDAFAGAVNLSDKLNANPRHANETDDDYIFVYSGKKFETQFRIDKDKLNIIEYKLLNGNKVELQSAYSEFSDVKSVSVPQRILVKYPYEDAELNIDYREVKVNIEIKNMKIEILKDTKIVKL